jgi:hypothetical protein
MMDDFCIPPLVRAWGDLRGLRNPEALEQQRDTARAPHWSHSIEWRAGRWDPMDNAPRPCTEIRGRDEKGNLLEPMHYAQDLSGEDQPAFIGWFVPMEGGQGFRQVHPVEWQPLRATP